MFLPLRHLKVELFFFQNREKSDFARAFLGKKKYLRVRFLTSFIPKIFLPLRHLKVELLKKRFKAKILNRFFFRPKKAKDFNFSNFSKDLRALIFSKKHVLRNPLSVT